MRHVAAIFVAHLLTEELKQSALKSVKNILCVQSMMKTFVKKTSLWVKRNGFMAMMLKQKTTLNNGHRKHLSEPKNQGRDSER
jgi:hypothetical protein